MLRVRQVTASRAGCFLTAVKSADRKTHTVVDVQSVSSHSWTSSPNEPPAAARIVALFAAVRRLRADARASGSGSALRGKNLALLLSGPSEREISPLHRAAQDLGVRVAEVLFAADSPKQADIGTLARVLGRMYDAIDCDTLPPSTVRSIERGAGVPVYAGLGHEEHRARVMADLLTLCEHGTPQATAASLLFIGDAKTSRSRAFLAAARELGFSLRVAEAGHAPSNDSTCVVDATRAPKWALYTLGRPVDEARRSENHRCVIQTVLLDTIPRG